MVGPVCPNPSIDGRAIYIRASLSNPSIDGRAGLSNPSIDGRASLSNPSIDGRAGLSNPSIDGRAIYIIVCEESESGVGGGGVRCSAGMDRVS